jgi:transcriptional regulator with XRE-family HTH domain
VPHNNIASLRDRAKLTQSQLANLTKTSQPYISQLESGDRTPEGEALVLLCKALGVKPAQLGLQKPESPLHSWNRKEVMQWWKQNGKEVLEIMQIMKQYKTQLQYPGVSLMRSVLMILEDVAWYESGEKKNGKP